MEKNDIKLMWQKAYSCNECENKVNIERIIREKQNKIITKILNSQRFNIVVYSVAFITVIGIMIYALGILRITLSTRTIITFSLVVLFLLLKTILEINCYQLLSNTPNDTSMKESILIFKQKLNRVKLVEFTSTLIYCYTWVIWLVFILRNDFNDVTKSIFPFLIFLILIFLVIPWLIPTKYKNLSLNLDKDIQYLTSK